MEGWATFFRLDESGETVFSVDRAMLGQPSEAFPYRASVTFEFPASWLAEHGIEAAEVPQLYYAFEDVILRRARGHVTHLIGTRTSQTSRTAFFCSSDPGLTGGLRKMAGKIEKFRVSVAETEPDELDQLIPSTIDMQLTRDIEVVLELQQAGDDPLQERDIDHMIVEIPDGRRAALQQQLTAMGYAIEREDGDAVQFKRREPIDLPSIHLRTRQLIALCETMDSVYDGWGSPVLN